MSTQTDVDDTANLPILKDLVQNGRQLAESEARAKAGSGAGAGADAGADADADARRIPREPTVATGVGARPRSSTHPHPFAEGIIRFYRARSILDANSENQAQAWHYLEPLSPFEVPPVARKTFIEFAYFMQQQGSTQATEPKTFCDSVQAIAALLDGFVDELNSKLDG